MLVAYRNSTVDDGIFVGNPREPLFYLFIMHETLETKIWRDSLDNGLTLGCIG